jgi:hypothetical protein
MASDRLATTASGLATPTTAFLDGPGGPSKTPAEARQRLEAIVLPKPEEPSPYGQVERVSLRPNEYTFYWRANEVPLRQALKDNQPLVTEAKANLDPADRTGFDRLWKLAADDIGAQAALQVLLLEGTLTGGPASTDKRSLLAELTRLADRPLAKGLDRTNLLCDLMQEIGFPSSISQRHRGTCTVTSVQILTARERPAEYARLVSDLAAADFEPVVLADGSHWNRETGTEVADDSDRTASSRLFQAAAMEAMIPDADYDNSNGTNTKTDGTTVGPGNPELLGKLTQSLLGPGSYAQGFWSSDVRFHGRMADLIVETAKLGQPTLVGVYRSASVEAKDQGAGHALLVIGATDDGVRYINPWGQIETMSRETLAKTMFTAVALNTKGPACPTTIQAALDAPIKP